MGKYRNWTDKENQLFKKYYPTKGSKYVAKLVDRTSGAVYLQAQKLGLKSKRLYSHHYTPQEIIFIKRYYPLKGSGYVAQKLGRRRDSIRTKAISLRVERSSRLLWDEKEIAYLKKWYGSAGKKGKKRPSEIARHLKRTTQSVVRKAIMLGLLKSVWQNWTNQEEHYVIKNFRNMTYKQIGKHLNRTVHSVKHRVQKMKMIKMPERDWTPQEKRFLARFYDKLPVAEIAKRLNRIPGSVISHAHLQKLKKPHPADYTEKEKNFIRKNYLKMTNEQIASKLNAKLSKVKRTSKGVGGIASVLGLAGSEGKKLLTLKNRKNIYSEKEKNFIRKNYLKMTNKEIAKKLNRPLSGINDIAARRLKLTNLPGKQSLWKKGNAENFYTEEDIKFIRKNYPEMTIEQIADKLNRTVRGIEHKIRYLKLKRHSGRR